LKLVLFLGLMIVLGLMIISGMIEVWSMDLLRVIVLLGLPVLVFGLLYTLYGYLFARYPISIETASEALVLSYPDGKNERIPYVNISSAFSAPNPVKDSAVLTLFFKPRASRWRRTRPFTIIGAALAAEIVKEIEIKISS